MSTFGVSWRIFFALLLIGLVLAMAQMFIVVIGLLLLIYAGVLFGIFMNGLSGWVAKRSPLSYRWSYALVVFLFLALLGGGFYYMGSNLARQASQFRGQLESATKQLQTQLKKQPYLPDLSQLQQVVSGKGSALSHLTTAAGWLLWGLTGVLVIFFVGLYVAYDPNLYEAGLVKLVPRERRDRARQVLSVMRTALGKWIIGRLLSMAVTGVLTVIGLWLLNVPLPVTLGVITALLTFVPNIGPILATIPQALLALNVGTSTVLSVVLLNIGLQTVESYLITPIIQRYQVTLPPALIILMQLVMGVVVGVIGLITAAPLAVALMVIVQMLYIEDCLGDAEPGQLVESI